MELKVPPEIESVGGVYSNFDHDLDHAIAERVKTENVAGEHYAWNFWGLVWKDQATGKWYEMVKQYQQHVDTVEGVSLEEVIEATNEKYGSD